MGYTDAGEVIEWYAIEEEALSQGVKVIAQNDGYHVTYHGKDTVLDTRKQIKGFLTAVATIEGKQSNLGGKSTCEDGEDWAA